MIMTDFNKISDEELAAYLEGMLSEQDMAKVDHAMDIDTLEVLGVSHQAMDEFHSDKMVELPSWDDVDVSTAAVKPLYNPLAMAGFLGDSDTIEDEEGEDFENKK